MPASLFDASWWHLLLPIIIAQIYKCFVHVKPFSPLSNPNEVEIIIILMLPIWKQGHREDSDFLKTQ